MASPVFEVVPQRNRTFNVDLTTADGRIKTMTDFGSEHEATAWAIQTMRVLQEVGPWFPLPTRDMRRNTSQPPIGDEANRL